MTIKTILKLILKILVTFVLLIVLYLITAIGLSKITANSDFNQCNKDAVEIYILTNGVHTDLVLPILNDIKDWSSFVNPADTKSGCLNANYVAFGWGDKGFYLETPTWADLKFKTAFNAAFFLSTTAMHVSFYNGLKESESCKKICINKNDYLKLVSYINNSFALSQNTPILIKGANYGNNDLFYDAIGTYSFLNTCNTWANAGLKSSNLKACFWTPFDKGIFEKY
jgi:uncharacterized protein (TIGR02117 family)